jgi:hypothetical protein
MTESTEEPAAELPTEKISRRTVIIVAAMAILVLTGAGVGIYFLTTGNGGTDTAAPASTGAVPGGAAPGTPTSGQLPATSTSAAAPAEVGNAKVAAEKAIQAINSHDPEALKKVSCDPAAVGPAEGTPPEARAELVSSPELTGDTATVELKLTIGDVSTTTPLPLRKQNGTWCVD